MWGSLGELNEEPVGWQGWIFYVTHPPFPPLPHLSPWVYGWMNTVVSLLTFLSGFITSLQSDKYQKNPPRLFLKTMYNFFESPWKQDGSHTTQIFNQRMRKEDVRQQQFSLFKNTFQTALKEASWSWLTFIVDLGLSKNNWFLVIHLKTKGKKCYHYHKLVLQIR